MAEIRCPNCGKTNPDFFDVCQFCQTPLKHDSTLRIGDKPTKKNTGELEPVLPDWLKDVRQQARDLAEEDAAQQAAMPKSPKDEPLDFLAGLASQSQGADEEDVPDWLSSLNSTTKKEKSTPPPPATPETDFFAQFNTNQPAPQEPTPREEPLSWQSEPASASADRDELSDWFSKANEETVELPSDADLSQNDSAWGIPGEFTRSAEPPAPKEEEDLSWLRNLEDQARKTGELPKPKQEADWSAELNTPSGSPEQEDLSWLNNLGALPAADASAEEPTSQPQEELSWLNNLGALPSTNEPTPPAAPKEDLSWLNNLGDVPATEPPPQPAQSKEDLSWLNNLGASPQESAAQPSTPQEDLSWLNDFSAPASNEPTSQPAEKEDLSWLNNLGGVPAAEEPATPSSTSEEDLSWLNSFNTAPAAEQPSSPAQEDLSWLNAFGESQPSEPAATDDLSWLNDLQGTSAPLASAPFSEPPADTNQTNTSDTSESSYVPPFVPRRTEPLTPQDDTSIPDWLKSATEAPSMPVNAGQLDQFREDFVPAGPDEPFSWKNFVPEAKMDEEEEQPLSQSPGPFFDPSLTAPVDEASKLSNQDVDSLFSVDMPDWLSQSASPTPEKPQEEIGIHAEGGEALAPVDLPSWVQAMRPVEAVLSETTPVEDLPTEREGPLRGFHGILPAVPIGSSRRPQPIPLKLQATAEQQANSALLEQILASETSPRALVSVPAFGSERLLRWGIATLVLLILGAVLGLRTQFLPISANLPADVDAAAHALDFVPDQSNVLVVLDYEPSLAGEMEATSSPLLNHLASLRHPQLSFVSTSTNGPGLVERLMRNTNLNNPSGLGYLEGQSYFNLGYLPGGESGILGFIQGPQAVLASAGPGGFSQYSAVLLLTDHADSARAWIEQLYGWKQLDPTIANQPLLVVSSAQAGPMLQPYISSQQVNGMLSGLADAARYEQRNSTSSGMARSYWDAFGAGVILAVMLIVLGSLWSLFTALRLRRVEAGEDRQNVH